LGVPSLHERRTILKPSGWAWAEGQKIGASIELTTRVEIFSRWRDTIDQRDWYRSEGRAISSYDDPSICVAEQPARVFEFCQPCLTVRLKRH